MNITSILRSLLLPAALAPHGFAGDAPDAAPPAGVVVPRFTHPGTGQTFYFVLPDRFASGSTANDTGGLSGGPETHGFDPTSITGYHGGDFAGLTARLYYLQRLGVTAVWVTPPFRNQPVRIRSGGRPTSGYHGYWILDFLQVDPHLGTDAEFRTFVREAHARGLKVCLDIITNHTADVISHEGNTAYRDTRAAPYRDAAGRPFDIRAVAFNGLGDPAAFPALSADRSFPLRPIVPPGAENAKQPAWLNDPTLYHNRGRAVVKEAPESAIYADFRSLDGIMTEHPRVVTGFIEVYRHWLEATGVDAFRIDTAKHVNAEFWQAFVPALRARAIELGRPGFLQFGEVYNGEGNPEILSGFSTGPGALDTTLDFGFFVAARKFVSQGGSAAALAEFFTQDDAYTDHDGNVHSTPTFLGNHDAGRFGWFLQQDNPGATPGRLADLSRLGHGLLYLSRGQPVVYYGDEQGMLGRGDHEHSREDMFASAAPEYREAALLGTKRTGADDKFDETHPFYRLLRDLGALRAAHPALRTGAMVPRATGQTALFAFSRIGRHEHVEYLVVLNNHRTDALSAQVPTSQPAGARFRRIFDSVDATGAAPTLAATAQGVVDVTLGPLQFAVWQAEAALPVPPTTPRIELLTPAPGANLAFGRREVEGTIFPDRVEISAAVTGGDGFAEVTFALTRASRPGQFELLGTDDAPPWRVFWSPPSDLAPGEELSFIATVSDLRGHRATAGVGGVTVAARAGGTGIRGATVPRITLFPPALVTLPGAGASELAVTAEGTGPLEYQWLHEDDRIPGAIDPRLRLDRDSRPGRYAVVVRNRAGTAISPVTLVRTPPAADR